MLVHSTSVLKKLIFKKTPPGKNFQKAWRFIYIINILCPNQRCSFIVLFISSSNRLPLFFFIINHSTTWILLPLIFLRCLLILVGNHPLRMVATIPRGDHLHVSDLLNIYVSWFSFRLFICRIFYYFSRVDFSRDSRSLDFSGCVAIWHGKNWAEIFFCTDS